MKTKKLLFKNLSVLLITVCLNACALFEQKEIGKTLQEQVQKVCLSSEGKGRLVLVDHKFVFDFNSALEEETSEWFMSLVFPFYGSESFYVEWNKEKVTKFEASFENKILRDKNKVDPESLHLFLKEWANLILEIQKIKLGKITNSNLNWSSDAKTLVASSKISDKDNLKIEFKNITAQNYFGRYDVMMQSESSESVKLELIVRKCLEKSE